jgi:lipopolysaccharide export system permease protein
MNRLDRYIAATLLNSIGLVLAVLLVLAVMAQFLTEQKEIGIGHYAALDALSYAALNLPQLALLALPAAVLIGAMLGIGALARTHELTVMRAAGMSKLALVRAVLTAGMLIVIAALLVGEYVAPRFEQRADERKAFAKYNNVNFAGGGGAWLRDGDTIINIQRRSAAAVFSGVLVFKLTPDNRIAAVGRASQASGAGRGGLQLPADYAESRFSDDQVSAPPPAQHVLHSSADSFLKLAATDPAELGLVTLYQSIQTLRANQQDSKAYEFAFWSALARISAVLVAVVFALPFGFGSMRSAGSGARMTLGLMIGILYFFVQRTVASGTAVFNLDPLVLAWLPTALLALVATFLLVRVR